MNREDEPTILIAGASRGLGLAMAREFASRGWMVIGTVRNDSGTALQELAARSSDRVRVEMLDINEPDSIRALRDRLAGQRLDVLVVNAGITTGDPVAQVDDVSADEFAAVMATNALGPLRVIEALEDFVPKHGLIGAMSSGQGSIANNRRGQREVYRASKAALNMLMKSYAARSANAGRATVVLAPGWIRTDLGGPEAPYTLEQAVPCLVDVLIAKRDRPGIEYLDRFGAQVPW